MTTRSGMRIAVAVAGVLACVAAQAADGPEIKAEDVDSFRKYPKVALVG